MSPTPDPLDPVRRALAAFGEVLDPDAAASLQAYRELIAENNYKYALVSPGDVPKLVERHLAESAALARWIPSGPTRVLDFGSGAGLPGIVLAILRPRASVTLLESKRKKQVFLRLAVLRLGLRRARVEGPIEEDPQAADTSDVYERVVARAVAPLPELLPLVAPLLAPGGWLIAPKGSEGEIELRAAERVRESLGLEVVERRQESLTSAAGARITSTVFVFAKR